MKKNYLIITLLFCSVIFGQNSTFNNALGAGDGKWGTATNWSAGLPTGVATISANVDLDVNVTLSGNVTSGASTVTTSNNSKITIPTTTATISTGLLCNGANFNYNAPIEFNSGGNTTFLKSIQVNNSSGAPQRLLTLGASSVLTLNSLMRVVTQFDSKVVFRGKIEGSSSLQLTGISEFATTADNTGFNGDFVYISAGSATSGIVISNTTVDGGFLKAGRKVQVNNTGNSLTINGANSCDGNVVVGGTHTFTLNINANQESFGTISVAEGSLPINVGVAVTNLSFADCSAVAWGTAGTVTITGYAYGKIRFGTTSTALTAAQLSKITADGIATGQPLALDRNGFLILATGATTWTGGTGPGWNNSTNWSNGVPVETTAVTIGAGTFQPSAFVNASIKSLTINSGSTLLVNPNFNLTVKEAIVNNGTLTISNNANLIQVDDVTNAGSGSTIVNRTSNPLFRLDYTMWSSPVASQNLLTFSPATIATRFYTYDNTLGATGLYAPVASPSTTPFATGTGYLIRMPDTDATSGYDVGTATLAYPGVFTGTANNGTVTLSSLISDKFYAIGNPYPSTIGAQLFLDGNSTGGVLYFWRKTNGAGGSAYATFTSGGATTTTPSSAAPDGTIAVGQGFIVKTGAAATTLSFTNTMRTGNNSAQFFKTKQTAQKDRIWLNLTNANGAFSQSLVAYIADASSGVDRYDGKYINDSSVALTSNINNEEYVIQGRPAFDPSDIVALNFKTDITGDYTIAIDHVDGLFAAGQDIYLLDSKTGAETNLKEGAYNFKATAGVDNARFTLKYQKTLKVDTTDFNENSVSVFSDNGTLYVNSGKIAINSIQVFDVQGRLLAERKNVKSSTASLDNLKVTNQLLLVKILGEDNSVITKKILN